ncbi:hypothetical protein KFE25_008541 [Diacronema lutheri]|uniref:Uncharacterized protein n=1 Tax=Diacronema lutheri TaxID=2081491 RepID=A0A8J6CHF0_DIALT|nr:hypothetical protein KFE25_008541 [Diacronema lutheri]
MFRRKPAAKEPVEATFDRPELKQLADVHIDLGGRVGKLVHDDSGWRPAQPSDGTATGGAKGLAAENARLKQELNLLTLKVDILVEMLALANLDVDQLERPANKKI